VLNIKYSKIRVFKDANVVFYLEDRPRLEKFFRLTRNMHGLARMYASAFKSFMRFDEVKRDEIFKKHYYDTLFWHNVLTTVDTDVSIQLKKVIYNEKQRIEKNVIRHRFSIPTFLFVILHYELIEDEEYFALLFCPP